MRNIQDMSGELDGYLFRPAEVSDAQNVTALVDAAYGHYLERLQMKPGPMTEDYVEVIRNHAVTVAVSRGSIVGLIVLRVSDEVLFIDNVAVHPHDRGRGVGRTLLQFAEGEARRAGFNSIHLYTHEKMTENLALYSKVGYVEYARRSQGSFALVYMQKTLSASV